MVRETLSHLERTLSHLSSQYDVANGQKQAQTLDISTTFQPYSGVVIYTGAQDSNGNEIKYSAGDASGRVLTIDNPWGTQAQANNILTQIRGFTYQPYEATGALVDPSAELGDGVTVNDVYSGIYRISRNYSALMAANIAAPQSEEIDHEYPYESKATRSIERKFSAMESELRMTSSEISAKVSKTSPSGQTSFSWSLQNNQWEVKSNGKTVFKITSSGAEVNGKITATSGYIGDASGGFEIVKGSVGEWKMQSGMTYLWDEAHNGVYLGTNGISCGGAKFVVSSNGEVWASKLHLSGGSIDIGNNFSVNSSGNVTANNMKLTGTLNIGGTNITAASLRSGAQSAYNWSTNGTASGWSSTTAAWGTATGGGGDGPTRFNCRTLYNTGNVIYVNGVGAYWQEKTVRLSNGNTSTIKYLGQTTV